MTGSFGILYCGCSEGLTKFTIHCCLGRYRCFLPKARANSCVHVVISAPLKLHHPNRPSVGLQGQEGSTSMTVSGAMFYLRRTQMSSHWRGYSSVGMTSTPPSLHPSQSSPTSTRKMIRMLSSAPRARSSPPPARSQLSWRTYPLARVS